jgi:flavin reductase (DIM6/NTAB) family NADH-FMN oxidoreductase RutF
MLVCLRCGSPTLAAILRESSFAVNFLHDRAQPAAELFASGQPDRFGRIRWHYGPGLAGPQLPGDAHFAAHCHVSRSERVGDHAVVFGEVFKIWESADPGRPLLYGLRKYSVWPEYAQTS